MSRRYIFSSESVGEGHPDKVCDTISDAVLDACLEQDRHSRVACETYAKSNIVIVGGEITIPSLPEESRWKASFPFRRSCAKPCARSATSTTTTFFMPTRLSIHNIITEQSPDIAQGVDARAAEGQGDCRARRGRPRAHVRIRLQRNTGIDAGARSCSPTDSGASSRAFARAGKSAGCARTRNRRSQSIYENGKPIGISCVVVSTQHTRDVKHSEIRSFVIEEVIKKVLPKEMLNENDTVSGQSDRQFRDRRPAGRYRSNRSQNHRR